MDEERLRHGATRQSATVPARRQRLPGPFWNLLTGGFVSNIGDGLALVAYPWLASTMTGNPVLIGGVTVAMKLPWLVLTVPAGLIIDRTDRRKAMVVASVARVLTTAFIALLVVTGDVGFPALYLVLFVLGCAEVVYDSALLTIVPAVVPDRTQLDKANGWIHGAQNVANDFLGGPIAGFVLGFALFLPFALHSATAAVAAVTLALLPGAFRPMPSAAATAATTSGRGALASAWVSLAEGMIWLWRNRLIRFLAVVSGVVGATGSAALAVYVLFAREIMQTGPAAFGVTLALGGAGMVAGSQVVGWLTRRLGRIRVLTLGLVGQGFFLVLGGFNSNVVVISVVLFMWGLFGALWNVITLSLRQVHIPDHLLGRVGGAYRLVGVGGASALGIAVGSALVAALAVLVDRDIALRTPFVVAGAASIAAGLVLAARLTEKAIEPPAYP